MKFFQAFRMSIKAIRSKKIRSLLTMLGNVIGVAAVIALVSVTEANNKKVLDTMMSIGDNIVNVYAYEWNGGMVKVPGKSIGDRLRRFIDTELSEYTVGVTPQGYDWKRIKYGSKTIEANRFIYGSDQYSMCMGFKIEKGRDLCYMDIERANRVCVLGSYMAESLFGVKDPINQHIMINGEDFMVVGVFAQKDFVTTELQWSMDNMILTPYTASKYLNKQMEMNDYYVKVVNAEMVSKVIKLLEDYLSGEIDKDRGSYNVYSPNSYLQEIKATNDAQTVLLAIIAAISLVVGGIGIMNIMLVTVTERTREIGIRKAIGAPRRSIITQFLIEASVLSLIGGLIGVIVGFAVTLFWGKLQYHLIAIPNLNITLLAVMVSSVMGVVFGLYPAVKASALQPVVALRNE